MPSKLPYKITPEPRPDAPDEPLKLPNGKPEPKSKPTTPSSPPDTPDKRKKK